MILRSLACGLAVAVALGAGGAAQFARAQTPAPSQVSPPGTPGAVQPPLIEVPPPPSAEEPPPPGPETAAPPPPLAADAKTAKEKPAATTPLPEKAPEPLKRPRGNEAIIQALDKVTAQTVRFTATVNKPVRWKDLVFTVHSCESQAADETQKGAFAHMEIYSEPRVAQGRTPPPAKMIYRGWMFSEAPAVHAFEHPVYDVWLIACRTA